jgi:hypothetical protein
VLPGLAAACTGPTRAGVDRPPSAPSVAVGSTPSPSTTAVPTLGSSAPTTTPGGAGSIVNPISGVYDAEYLPATAGTYAEQVADAYDLNGRTVLVTSTGSLSVQAAGPPGGQTWAESSGPGQPTDALQVLFSPTGVTLQSESLALSASTLQCTFTPAVPILPLHPSFGSTVSSNALCGTFSAVVTTLEQGAGTITLGGVDYATLEVQSTIVTKGTTPATIIETSWVSPALRMAVRSVQRTSTKYNGLPYQITTTTSLTAAQPSS